MRLTVAAMALATLTACAPPPLTQPLDTGAGSGDAAPGSDAGDGQVPFPAVADIMREDCTGAGCHGADSGRAGLSIEGGAEASKQQVRKALDGTTVSGEDAKFIEPGQPDQSVIYQALKARNGRQQMPLSGKLEESKIETVRKWIAQGASYE